METDVLVVGGGLAALRAAIAAREAGARVTVAVKGKLGRSGSSAMTTAGYAAALPGYDDPDSAERHIADTLKGGWRVGERDLVELLCRGAADEVRYLETIGAVFETEGGRYRLSPSGDHSRSRVLVTENHLGTDITVPLAAHAERLGVEKLEFTMAVELIRGDAAVAGALCVETRTGATVAISACAVILATGGAGRLYTVTSNPNDVTGDGFSLGLRAGARLRDMEFVQFYPWRCIDPFDKARVSIQPSTFVHGARMYNARGERFMEAFNPDGAEVTTRDVAARGIFDQMRRGLGIGGGVRLDLSPLDPETFARSNPKVAKYLAKLGLDYASYPFVVSPEAHYWMGGLSVDADGATSVDKLFCVGEAAGGIHGANRINSNALPETLVFGARAGARAAGEAGAPRRAGPVDAARIAPREGGLDEAELDARLATLKTVAWDSLGIIRRRETIEAGISHVSGLAAEIAERGAASPKAARAFAELGFLCDTAATGLHSALYRQESRGAHFREDFPTTDDDRWRGSVTVEARGDGLSVAFAPLMRIEDAA